MDTMNEKINADFAGYAAFLFEDAVLSQKVCKRWSIIYTKQTLAAWQSYTEQNKSIFLIILLSANWVDSTITTVSPP